VAANSACDIARGPRERTLYFRLPACFFGGIIGNSK